MSHYDEQNLTEKINKKKKEQYLFDFARSSLEYSEYNPCRVVRSHHHQTNVLDMILNWIWYCVSSSGILSNVHT